MLLESVLKNTDAGLLEIDNFSVDSVRRQVSRRHVGMEVDNFAVFVRVHLHRNHTCLMSQGEEEEHVDIEGVPHSAKPIRLCELESVPQSKRNQKWQQEAWLLVRKNRQSEQRDEGAHVEGKFFDVEVFALENQSIDVLIDVHRVESEQ